MSNFLDSTGLSKLVENIKNKFQKKKTHCKLFDNGGYWTIVINDNDEYEIVKDGAALYEVLKDKLNDLIFDIKFANNYLLYNVNYNTHKDDDGSINIILTGLEYSTYDEPLTNMVKVGIWLYEDSEGDCVISKGLDIEITNLNIVNNLKTNGDGTKFLADDGKYKEINVIKYDDVINIPNTNSVCYMQTRSDFGVYDEVFIFADSVYASAVGIFNISNGKFKKTKGTYKLIYNKSANENIYVGDCIIDIPDPNKPSQYSITIKKVLGSDYYFTLAKWQTIDSGEEYVELTYPDIVLVDINDNTQYYDYHTITHNPHKNDDVVIYTNTEGNIPYNLRDNNVGFCKIVKEYFEGVRRYGISHDTHSIYPMINYDGVITDDGTIYNNINGFTEDVTVTVDQNTQNWINAKDRVGLLETYISNYSVNDTIYDPCKKIIRIINTSISTITVPICQIGVLSAFGVRYDPNQFLEYNSDNNSDIYNIVLRPKETCEITINIGSRYEELDDLGDMVYLRDEMYISINRISNSGNLLTFEAENGTIDEIQAWTVNYAHANNEPLYVLYSGIKMLVNGIQKLGDIYSLSCRHEGVVYSVTIDTAEMSYNVIANV